GSDQRTGMRTRYLTNTVERCQSAPSRGPPRTTTDPGARAPSTYSVKRTVKSTRPARLIWLVWMRMTRDESAGVGQAGLRGLQSHSPAPGGDGDLQQEPQAQAAPGISARPLADGGRAAAFLWGERAAKAHTRAIDQQERQESITRASMTPRRFI